MITPLLLKKTRAMDIFSLGCVLYYVMTDGQHPFGHTTFTRQKNILEDNPVQPSDENLKCTEEKNKLIMKMISLMITGIPEKRPNIGDIRDFFGIGKIMTEKPPEEMGRPIDTRFDISIS